MAQDKSTHEAQVLNGTGQTAHQAASYVEDSEGLAITHEQVSDVYKAGTSDGILILEGGIIVNLKEDR